MADFTTERDGYTWTGTERRMLSDRRHWHNANDTTHGRRRGQRRAIVYVPSKRFIFDEDGTQPERLDNGAALSEALDAYASAIQDIRASVTDVNNARQRIVALFERVAK